MTTPQFPADALSDERLNHHLDAILRASGSALKHFSLAKPKDDMRAALKAAIDESRALRTPAPSGEAVEALSAIRVSRVVAMLDGLCIGSCSCQTKTNDWKHHASTCQYLAYGEAIECLEALASRQAAAPTEPSEVDLDEERCGVPTLESELRFRHEHELRNAPGYRDSLLCRRTVAALAAAPAQAMEVQPVVVRWEVKMPTLGWQITTDQGAAENLRAQGWEVRPLGVIAPVASSDSSTVAQEGKPQ